MAMGTRRRCGLAAERLPIRAVAVALAGVLAACAGPAPGPAPLVYAVPPAGGARLAAAPQAMPAASPHRVAEPAPPPTARPASVAPVKLAELPPRPSPKPPPKPAATPLRHQHAASAKPAAASAERHAPPPRRRAPPPATKPVAAAHRSRPKMIPLQSPEAETKPASTKPPTAARQEAALPKPGPSERAAHETRAADFLWPVRGRILSGFGPGPHGTHNDGINIAAPRGAPVQATAAGTVAYAGNELRGYGNLILITHRKGWISAYAHCRKLLVKRGQTVRRGQIIARVGATGNVTAPQLHFELRRGEKPVDPLEYLGPLPTAAAGSRAGAG